MADASYLPDFEQYLKNLLPQGTSDSAIKMMMANSPYAVGGSGSNAYAAAYQTASMFGVKLPEFDQAASDAAAQKAVANSPEGQARAADTSTWNNIRDNVEAAGVVAGNYYLPGSAAITGRMVSSGAQEDLGNQWGALALAGSGIAGGTTGNFSNYGKAGSGMGDWLTSLFGDSGGAGVDASGAFNPGAWSDPTGASSGSSWDPNGIGVDTDTLDSGWQNLQGANTSGSGWGSLINGAGNLLGGAGGGLMKMLSGGGANGMGGLGAILGALMGAQGAKGAPTSMTTTNAPWASAIPSLQGLLGATNNFATSPLPYANSDEMVAGFNPLQTQAFGQGQDWASALAMPTLNNALSGLNGHLGGDLMDVNSNPYLKGAITAATDPITDAFQRVVMPALRSQGNVGDATGKTRLGIAQGNASTDYLRQIGNTSASMASAGYGQGLNATQNFYSMTPSLVSASAMPWQNLLQLGNQQQAQAQKTADAKGAFDNLTANRLNLSSGILNNVARGGSSTTAPAPYQSPWLTALGGGIAGSQVGKLFA